MRIGKRIPVDCLPPNINASVGTTIIEIPGIPAFAIPTSIAQTTIRDQSVIVNPNDDDNSTIDEGKNKFGAKLAENNRYNRAFVNHCQYRVLFNPS